LRTMKMIKEYKNKRNLSQTWTCGFSSRNQCQKEEYFFYNDNASLRSKGDDPNLSTTKCLMPHPSR
jgi:hypothetical protein